MLPVWVETLNYANIIVISSASWGGRYADIDVQVQIDVQIWYENVIHYSRVQLLHLVIHIFW
jgi:hypothetical protein